MESPTANRILVIRLGALGDVLRTLPALARLRRHYPGAHITWLVERKSAGALEGNPHIDETLVFPREELSESLRRGRPIALFSETARFIRRLRAGRYDLVLDFHAILKSGVIARLSGAPVRAGFAPPFARELSWLFANRRARLAPDRVSRFARNDALLQLLGVVDGKQGASSEGVVAAPLPIDAAALARVDEALGPGEPVVAIHPGTSEATPYKRYAVAGYGAVARSLVEHERVRCLVTRGPGRAELERAQAVVDAAGGAAELAPETPRFADLAALLMRCELFIGSDSGPLHAASLVGTPVVQILGPTDPVENAPYSQTPSRTIRVPVVCSPCRSGCAAATCMRLVEPAGVADAARALLARTRGTAKHWPASEPQASEVWAPAKTGWPTPKPG